MVAGNKRSKSFRKVFVKTPGGRTTIHWRKRKPSHAICPRTGQKLHGVARNITSKLKNLSISRKRPSRPFGGHLSSEAMREELRSRVPQEAVEQTGPVYGVGRLCMKLAGRDAGNICVIVDQDKDMVTIDGNVRRRTCNPHHLQPLAQTIKLKKGASHSDVEKAFKDLDLPVWNTKKKEAKEKPKKKRVGRKTPAKKTTEKKAAKKAAKKPAVKEEKAETKKAAPAKEKKEAPKTAEKKE